MKEINYIKKNRQDIIKKIIAIISENYDNSKFLQSEISDKDKMLEKLSKNINNYSDIELTKAAIRHDLI